ncbi:inhibitor of toxin/antitoxin system [Pectobacterium phage PP47]|uniref:Inhibitor of toxin/antitoxin system n=2 Tax=Pektosvirus TaxID=2732689 RepID=A0A7S8WIF2_9CAUD|nr:inhibitor of toxin/antitoxin system [Pectobacterium phage PP47]YP_009948661.1 inhibitor of toxin/antitoxin system [Pectobacterium phage PP81]APW79763.1 inhibitor of toxin/antitoxin system [Pectobacterium phage PP47]QPF15821.1 inhibitor of toxin/antitoxin system [Pectobacterium phage PP81]
MLKAPIKASTTIRLSDTVDQWSRRIHVNVRNGKPTLVYRWRDSKSPKSHTQRVTLSDVQVGRLIAALSIATGVAADNNESRLLVVANGMDAQQREAGI